MKLVSYLKDEHDSLGVLVGDKIFSTEVLHPDLRKFYTLICPIQWDCF
jgi:hypothetical protein